MRKLAATVDFIFIICMRVKSSAFLLLTLLITISHVCMVLSNSSSAKKENTYVRLNFPPIVPGLAYGYYSKSCPAAEFTVFQMVQSFLSSNVSQAAGLVRLIFHDCFVQGCDASVLLNDSSGEQFAIPNLTLRSSAIQLIEQIKARLEGSCPGIVSCADILALAAADAVFLAGGPFIFLPTGRRDSLNFADSSTVLANLPAPFFNSSQLIASFASKGLNETDLVALSGGHTIGIAHCSSFDNRLQPKIDPTLNASFAQSLLQICPNSSVNNPTNMDIITPDTFDNNYFNNIEAGQVLFTSDASLLSDTRTQDFVVAFSTNQSKFFMQFFSSFTKMTMISVLTGSNGNIRHVCSSLNSNSSNAPKNMSRGQERNIQGSNNSMVASA